MQLGEMIMKQNKEKFDFKAFGQAIKAARKAKGISRNQLADKLNIAPRYIASIENSGQHPSLQTVSYTHLDVYKRQVSITSTMFVGLKLYKNEPNKYNVIFSTIDGRRIANT